MDPEVKRYRERHPIACFFEQVSTEVGAFLLRHEEAYKWIALIATIGSFAFYDYGVAICVGCSFAGFWVNFTNTTNMFIRSRY